VQNFIEGISSAGVEIELSRCRTSVIEIGGVMPSRCRISTRDEVLWLGRVAQHILSIYSIEIFLSSLYFLSVLLLPHLIYAQHTLSKPIVRAHYENPVILAANNPHQTFGYHYGEYMLSMD
jgi:hypothetical protein